GQFLGKVRACKTAYSYYDSFTLDHLAHGADIGPFNMMYLLQRFTLWQIQGKSLCSMDHKVVGMQKGGEGLDYFFKTRRRNHVEQNITLLTYILWIMGGFYFFIQFSPICGMELVDFIHYLLFTGINQNPVFFCQDIGNGRPKA